MSEHPVFIYLNEKINVSGMSKKDIVIKMGYKNVTKGLRRLQNVLNGGSKDEQFLVKLSQVLSFPVEEIIKIRSDYEYRVAKEVFRPHLLAVTSNHIPSPIFVGAMVAHQRFIYFEDDFLELEYIDQLARVSGHVIAHMVKQDGRIPAFGRIKYYILQRAYDEAKSDRLFFDTSGSLIDNPEPQDKSEPGTASLTVKGRNILPILRFDVDNEQNVL
jgi:hypothetical protein